MKRKEMHHLKVSEGERIKMRQPNKKESLNKTSDEERGSQIKIKLEPKPKQQWELSIK